MFRTKFEKIEKARILLELPLTASMINGGVKEALEIYIKKVEKKKVYDDMKAAAQDPLFINDLEDSMKDFSNVDFESEEKENIPKSYEFIFRSIFHNTSSL